MGHHENMNVIIANFFLDIFQPIIIEIIYANIMILYFFFSNCVHIRVDGSSLLPVVGWPPVRAHRKNNFDGLSLLKFDHEMQESKSDAKRLKLEIDNEVQSVFVKVKMEGYSVGRKVNLKVYDGYRSLSRALSKLFLNFLSGMCVRLI